MIDSNTASDALFVGLVGAVVAAPVLELAKRRAPESLMRTNVDGRRVPAILGLPLGLGGLAGVVAAAVGLAMGWFEGSGRVLWAVALILVLLGAAGRWDDERGDERPRGFGGHLAALRGGRLTGGIVKLIVGGVTGLIAGRLLTDDLMAVLEVGLLVALAANLINLLDRAPGRAGKFALLLLTPLVVWGSPLWLVAAAGTIAALIVCLPSDLGARAMLGDAGANPLGGVIGLGLALALNETWRFVAIGVLVLLNLASEKWSFGRLIERSGPLRAFDMWGRPRPGEKTPGD